jgi:hypothetical protein
VDPLFHVIVRIDRVLRADVGAIELEPHAGYADVVQRTRKR